MHVDPKRYSVIVQLDDAAVQTSPEPVPLLEVAPTAQAHMASLDVVAAVLAYALPEPQTVTADAHSVRMVPEDVESEVDVAKKPEPQLVHERSAVDEASVA